MKVRIALTVVGLCGLSTNTCADETESGALTLPSMSVSETRAEQASSYRAETSSVATKTDTPLRDVPQTVNVVTKELMKDQNVTSLQEALKNVPGISADAGDGQRDQFVIRGFSALNDMYIDGMRDDAFYFRDLSNIERVDVLKGPASVLYGRGSSGGLINRVIKRPLRSPVQEFGVQLGSYGQRRSEIDLGGAADNDSVRVRLTGALEDSDGFRDEYFLKRQAIAPSVLFNLSPDTTFVIQADYLHDDRLADTGLPAYGRHPVDADISKYYGSDDAEDENNVETTVKGITFTLDQHMTEALSLHSALRTYDSKVKRKYITFSSVNTSTDTVRINRAERLKEEKGFFWQNELTHYFSTGFVDHQALYGLEIGYQDKQDEGVTLRNVATYDVFHPDLIELEQIPGTTKPNPDSDTDIRTAGLYLQDIVTLTPSWKLVLGGRFDRLETDRKDDGTGNLDLKRIDRNFSPRIGIVYQPADWISMYASWSRSFQPITDSTELRKNSDELEPEETTNREVGVKMDVLENASLTLSLFNMKRTSILMDDPDDSSLSVAAGTQRTKGIEVSLSGKLGNGWSANAGYALLDGEMISSPIPSIVGNRSPLTPRSSGNLWLKKELSAGFFIAGGMKYEGKRYTSPNNRVVLGSYTEFDLSGGYRSEKFDVTLNVTNVFDHEYFVSAKAGSDNSNYPGAPRTASLNTKYRF